MYITAALCPNFSKSYKPLKLRFSRSRCARQWNHTNFETSQLLRYLELEAEIWTRCRWLYPLSAVRRRAKSRRGHKKLLSFKYFTWSNYRFVKNTTILVDLTFTKALVMKFYGLYVRLVWNTTTSSAWLYLWHYLLQLTVSLTTV